VLTTVLVLAAIGIWPTRSTKYEISIASPNGSIPRCATITGSASIPSGDSLWIAQRAAAEKPYYNLNEVAIGDGNAWQITTTVGPANATGVTFTVVAFALNAEASQVLLDLATSPTNSYFYLQALPQQVTEQTSRNMTRNTTDITACP